jgi:hypothetical protein
VAEEKGANEKKNAIIHSVAEEKGTTRYRRIDIYCQFVIDGKTEPAALFIRHVKIIA